MRTSSISFPVASLLLASAATAQYYEARNAGMGGVGTASSNYLAAGWANPALLTRSRESDDFGLILPTLGATAYDKDGLIDDINSFVDAVDRVAAWLAGFFHNAGRILVNGAAAELEAQGWPIAQRIHFGSWKKRLCAIAGAELALSWDLPDDVVDGASQHFDRLGPLTPDMALVALGTRITTRLRSREEDDGGMVVTEAIVNGLRRDRLALLATLEGVDAAVDRACDLVN